MRDKRGVSNLLIQGGIAAGLLTAAITFSVPYTSVKAADIQGIESKIADGSVNEESGSRSVAESSKSNENSALSVSSSDEIIAPASSEPATAGKTEPESAGSEIAEAKTAEPKAAEVEIVDEETTAPEVVKHKDGWVCEEENWYYFLDDKPVSGWLQLGNTWYYMDGQDTEHPYRMVAEASRNINGGTYYFGESGAMQSGWQKHDGGWYYHTSWGNAKTGWLQEGSVWYYLQPAENGLMAASRSININGGIYYFGQSGAMQSGWQWHDGGWYYHTSWGNAQTGWLQEGSVWYYLQPLKNGLMAASQSVSISDKVYYFGESGAMQSGWQWHDGGWYYHTSWGNSQTGWLLDGSTWYYLDPVKNGLMVSSGWRSISGTWYFFRPSGAMATGWIYDGGKWYYALPGGNLKTGWQSVGGKWYYLDPKTGGQMLSSGWYGINGADYYLNESGEMATDWLWQNGGWYYFGKDGAMKTGWQNTSLGRYYFYKYSDPNGGSPGHMAHDTTIDGTKIPSDGNVSVVYGKAARRLDQIGWDLRAAFRWSSSMPYVNVSDSPSPGSEYFADYGFSNHAGDCYVMAATFYYMAKALGYDAHQMSGYVPLLAGGIGVHSWVEIDINGGTYVFDPSFTQGTNRNGYWFTYGTSGTWRYMDYYRMN